MKLQCKGKATMRLVHEAHDPVTVLSGFQGSNPLSDALLYNNVCMHCTFGRRRSIFAVLCQVLIPKTSHVAHHACREEISKPALPVQRQAYLVEKSVAVDWKLKSHPVSVLAIVQVSSSAPRCKKRNLLFSLLIKISLRPDGLGLCYRELIPNENVAYEHDGVIAHRSNSVE